MAESQEQAVNTELEGVGGSNSVADGATSLDLVGGKRRGRKGSKKRGSKKRTSMKKGSKKRGTKERGTKKRGSKGSSPWIMHVKAFCKKTGKTFPEALKDPMCGKTYKR